VKQVPLQKAALLKLTSSIYPLASMSLKPRNKPETTGLSVCKTSRQWCEYNIQGILALDCRFLLTWCRKRLSQAEAVKEMIHLEKSFSKQTSARILARWKGETPQVREMVLEDKHSHQFREVSLPLRVILSSQVDYHFSSGRRAHFSPGWSCDFF